MTQPQWQTPRAAIIWMQLSVAASLALHAGHLPAWLIAAALTVMAWQICVYRGVIAHPSTWHKVLLTSACLGGVLVTYDSLIGLEPMVAILISGFALKLLEIHRRRDALLLIYLAYFVVVVQCLFTQGITTAALMVASVCVITTALIAVYQQGERAHGWLALRKSTLMLAQAVPLMLVLFIIIPRLGPLWVVPQQASAASIGVSDSMTPGDFTDLSATPKVAFRVSFDGDMPAQASLYWRGLVLSKFDGRTWSQLGPWGYRTGNLLQWYGDRAEPWDSLAERRGQPLDYTVTLEPSNGSWLFALATPRPASPGIALTRDFRLYTRSPVVTEKQYRAQSWLDYKIEPERLPPWRRSIELRLPEGFNPKTREVAARWREETPDPEALVQRLLDYYRRDFVYTLKPPLLGKHTVDEFLWQTRRGFCEFFAGSFVFFMRAAGVPARVVVGYQGGERHPEGDYMLVHQYDAHAWAEVWLAGRGWVRVDPTAAVAPARIESSFADYFSAEEGFLDGSPLALERFRHIGWINSLRLQLDELEYAWAKWVLGYDSNQMTLLSRILGRVDPMRMGMLLLFAGSLALLPVGWMLLRSRQRPVRDDIDRCFLEFCRRMARLGLGRRIGEGPRDYAARIANQKPELAPEIWALVNLYERQRYATAGENNLALRQALRRIPRR